MSFARETQRGDGFRWNLVALTVWLTTLVFSGWMVAQTSARLAHTYAQGWFATEDLDEELFPLNFFILLVLLAAATACTLFRTRLRPRVFLIAVAIHFGVVAVATVSVNHARERSIEALVARAQHLVDGIRSFEKQHGRGPANLDALVPEFLPSAPESFIDCRPDIYYSADPDAGGWKITGIPCSGIWLDYAPEPSVRYLGEDSRRIGDWIVADFMH